MLEVYGVCDTTYKGCCCVSRGSLLWLFICQWPAMPDPSLSLSPLALYSVFSHLRGNQRRMLLCWCLSTAKVSPVCLMDLPVRFSVRFRVPQQSWTAGPCHCLSQGVSEPRQGGDEIGLIMAALFLCYMVLKLCSCGPGDAWSNRDTQRLWKRLAVAHSPQSAMLPTYTTFCSLAELLPSQPFTHRKALFHPAGTLTFVFCRLQRIF